MSPPPVYLHGVCMPTWLIKHVCKQCVPGSFFLPIPIYSPNSLGTMHIILYILWTQFAIVISDNFQFRAASYFWRANNHEISDEAITNNFCCSKLVASVMHMHRWASDTILAIDDHVMWNRYYRTLSGAVLAFWDKKLSTFHWPMQRHTV